VATIRLERAEDRDAANAIVAEAFGPGRFAKSAYRLREGVKAIAALSFVAEDAGRIVGTVRYWPIDIGGAPALMLGPIAIVASMQGQGIALALMQTSLEAARKLGYRAVVLVGDEPYYGRAGFKRIAPSGRITMSGPVDYGRLLGLSLVEGALDAMKGEIRKAALDESIAAPGAALASFAAPA
jgi:predicted N-acetyltransferase YhbS